MEQPLIQTVNLKKYFNTPRGKLHAVDDVNLSIQKGQTLGVVGESGCGKSTLGRVLLRLSDATSGQVLYNGEDVLQYNRSQVRRMRAEMQMIFQDPYASLNPRMTVSEIIAEPIRIMKTITDNREINRKVFSLMNTVGLAGRLVNAYPHELDGGRRQRIGIARALALNPKFIVCDEPVSALDVSIQAQILNLMKELQKKYPGRVFYSRIDVTDEKASEHLRHLIRRMGGMDVYFHIAGIGYGNDELEVDKEVATMQTNVVGFTRMVDTAFRYFRDERAGFGQIAAITSVAGTNGLGHLAAYSASKRFQQTYLRALNQLATIQKLHIKFTDIRPGWIRTPLLDDDRNYPMIMQLPYAVPRIIRAIRRRRRVSVVDWRWNILVGLWRLIPNSLWVRLPVPVETIASRNQQHLNAAEASYGDLQP